MDVALPTQLIREGFTLLFEVGSPIFGALLVVGISVGVMQAATQINDPAMSFLPRLFALLTVLWALGGWAAGHFASFFEMSVNRMVGG
ncbi:MAG: flagellar biosynthetic protein FliQ [Deltaproteobacteria bacterium]|nr:flagellar biosynthetic protein FliQ [Deltaproteobacteria bacterium]